MLEDREELYDEHLRGLEIGVTDPGGVAAMLGEPTRTVEQYPLLQMIYEDVYSELGRWEWVAYTFIEDELRAVTWYEPRPPVPRDGPIAAALGEPVEGYDALAAGWGIAEGNARCEAFPLDPDAPGEIIVTGTDNQGNLQYIALTAVDVEERTREEAACPVCGWHPPESPDWVCDECGHEFDTFETRAHCPGCGKSWETTQCNACGTYSTHADWWLDGAT